MPASKRFDHRAQPSRSPGSRTAAQWIGFADQPPGLYEYFTVAEHVAFVAEARGAEPPVAAEQTAQTLAMLGLAAIAARPCRELSYGMRQRVGLAAALVGNTRVVLLDETLNGLDPHAARHAYAALSAHTANGGAVLLSTHLLGGLPPRCDRVMLMYGGKITQNLAGAELATLLARGPDALNDLYLANIPDTGPTYRVGSHDVAPTHPLG